MSPYAQSMLPPTGRGTGIPPSNYDPDQEPGFPWAWVVFVLSIAVAIWAIVQS